MPEPNFNFQKAALAVLLCTESTLGKKWRTASDAVSVKDLEDLGFSKDFATKILHQIRSMGNQHRHQFGPVAQALQTFVWPGRPPHPPDDQAKAIVRALLAIDD